MTPQRCPRLCLPSSLDAAHLATPSTQKPIPLRACTCVTHKPLLPVQGDHQQSRSPTGQRCTHKGTQAFCRSRNWWCQCKQGLLRTLIACPGCHEDVTLRFTSCRCWIFCPRDKEKHFNKQQQPGPPHSSSYIFLSGREAIRAKLERHQRVQKKAPSIHGETPT